MDENAKFYYDNIKLKMKTYALRKQWRKFDTKLEKGKYALKKIKQNWKINFHPSGKQMNSSICD